MVTTAQADDLSSLLIGFLPPNLPHLLHLPEAHFSVCLFVFLFRGGSVCQDKRINSLWTEIGEDSNQFCGLLAQDLESF